MNFMSRARRFLDRCMSRRCRRRWPKRRPTRRLSMVGRGLRRAFVKHGDDFAGVIFDVICIAASIALIPTGIDIFAIAGLAGGAVLLGCDGAAYAMEVAGQDESAKSIKENTEWVRLAATIATLPDFGWNGIKAVRELRALRELRSMATTPRGRLNGWETVQAMRPAPLGTNRSPHVPTCERKFGLNRFALRCASISHRQERRPRLWACCCVWRCRVTSLRCIE